MIAWIYGTRVRGHSATIIAALAAALTPPLFYAAHLFEPTTSGLTVCFVRVWMACLLVLPQLNEKIWGDCRRSLWLWGISGAVTVLSFFCSIHMIGGGQSSFLQSSQGAFVLVLAPLMVGQTVNRKAWLSLIGVGFGLLLMLSPNLAGWNRSILGQSLALVSGLSAAIAYLAAARASQTNSIFTLSFYWCWICLLCVTAAGALFQSSLPTKPMTWGFLLLGGLSASVSQFYFNRAYQTADAAGVAVISYLAPVLSFAVDLAIFQLHPPPIVYLGVVLVFASSIMQPVVIYLQRAKASDGQMNFG